MKITSIQTSNFLGARAVDLAITKPVALIAGKNGAGKSSIQEAVRMALTGEPVRVSLKKDYAALLSEGAEAGFADIMTDQSKYSVVLPGGKGVHCDIAALPYVLDAQRFARMDDKERRTFLFGLMGVKLDGPAIKARLIAKGSDAAKVEQVMPILRAGFDAASKEAASKARDAKAAWKTVTGGETWGKDKAATWQPAAVACTAEAAEKALVDIRRVITADDADIGKLQQEIGAGKAEIARRQSAESRRMELHNQAEQIGRILAEQGTALPDVESLEKTLREITQRRDQYREEERQTLENARLAAGRDKQIADAARHHADVLAWTDIADALAPDGIPAELLAEALDPINERLIHSASMAEWVPVQIGADMSIAQVPDAGKPVSTARSYALLSESEKWRADAMIAEAVSYISGLRLLVLDRFDVLDMKGREDLLYWLDGMAQDGDIHTALIFGTLKSVPALNFETIDAFWIDGGVAGQLKEAA